MNIHSRDVDKEIERSEAQAALDVLRSFIAEKGADALDGPHLTALRGLLPQRTRNFRVNSQMILWWMPRIAIPCQICKMVPVR